MHLEIGMWKAFLPIFKKSAKPAPVLRFRFVRYRIFNPTPARLQLLQSQQPHFRELIQHSIQLRAIDRIGECLFVIDEIKMDKVEHLAHRISVGGVLALEIVGNGPTIERGVASFWD